LSTSPVLLPAVVGLALFSYAVVFADSGPETTVAAPASAPPEPTSGQARIICVRKNATTGSILAPKPECHTAEEWKEIHGKVEGAGINDTQQFNSIERPAIVGTPTLGPPG